MENQPQQKNNNANRTKLLIAILIVLIIGGGSAGLIYLKVTSGRVYIEKSQITAPQIDLAPQTPGSLQEIYVQTGDTIQANSPVARVGDELIKAKVSGIIISTNNNIGKIFNPGEAVVSMIDPEELKVVGQIEEDKGLKDLRVGQRAMFTVDAFGSKQYYGTVDEVSPTSRNSDIVFSISDKRQLNEFNTEIRFNVDQYPELKNGMSAKLWIYK
jgi:multidrug resistance efflux pump